MKPNLLAASFACGFLMSCSFPNRAALKRVERVTDSLGHYAPIILSEVRKNNIDFQTAKISNASLRSYLEKAGIFELTVYYNDQAPNIARTDLYLPDSIITFHRDRSSTQRFNFEDIVYSFAETKPGNPITLAPETRTKQLSDSVWFVRLKSDLIITY